MTVILSRIPEADEAVGAVLERKDLVRGFPPWKHGGLI